jgi:hypothetical protein
MALTTRHISVRIERPATEVYAYAARPANLPRWAAGLAGGVERVEGRWVADSPMGRVTVEFAPDNEFGVLDHVVTMPDGQAVYNPMRVIPDGGACEVVFSVRPRPGMTEAELDRDAGAVHADLSTLKEIAERA